MSMIVVTPPAAAARVAEANPSHSVRPGSLTCTWVSTRPGSSTSSSARTTVSAAATAASRSTTSGSGRRGRRRRRRSRRRPRRRGGRGRPGRRAAGRGPVTHRRPCHAGRSAPRCVAATAPARRRTPTASTPGRPARRPRRCPLPGRVVSSSRHRPATATTGTPARRAAAATPAGALPWRVCSSSEPSPVTTRSAPTRASSRPVRACTTSTPGRSRAPSTAMAPKPDAPGGAGAVVVAHVGAGGLGHDVGEAEQRGVELGDLRRGRPLLRPVDRRGATRPEQRVVDVARDGEARLSQPGVQAGQVDAVHRGQALPALGDLVAVRVEQPHPQGAQHAGATVGRRAAADPEHDHGGAPGVERRGDDLADAPAARRHRRRHAAGQPGETADLRHLHHGVAAPPRVRRVHRLPGRAAGPQRRRLEPRPGGGVEQPVTAVGDGHHHDLGVRPDASGCPRPGGRPPRPPSGCP